VPRESPVGATSFPVKKTDMATAAAIEAFLTRRVDVGDTG
jgi:hypothetical protein